MELRNKTALVTGSTAGIGREVVYLLARDGASVIVSGRNAARGAEVVTTIEEFGGTARFVAADIGDPDGIRHLADEAGEVDILVNNAAIFPLALTTEQDMESYQLLFDTNVRGPFFLTAALVPGMIAKSSGSIVNVSSVAGLRGLLPTAVYGATKAALDSLTRVWAAEFGGHGIRVNGVAPGFTRTDHLLEFLGEETVEKFGSLVPLGSPGEPREVAEAIRFLASPRASNISGQILAVDGGHIIDGGLSTPHG